MLITRSDGSAFEVPEVRELHVLRPESMGEERHLLLRPVAVDPFLPEVIVVAADRRAATWTLNFRNPHGAKRSTAETARRALWLSLGC